MNKETHIRELTEAVNLVMRALLVAGKSGAPAEGLLPFNPLYFNILRLVGSAGSIRPSHLAERMSVSRTTMSTALKALQKRQLLATSIDQSDRRAVKVVLTKEGNDVLDAISRQDLRNSELMLSILNESDRSIFVNCMKKIARVLT